MRTQAWIDIDRGAYRRNLRAMRARVAPAEVMAVVKSDAYGHGLERLVPVAIDEGIAGFGALDLQTAARVRELVGPDVRVFVWLVDTSEYDDAVHLDVELGISALEQLSAAADAARRSGSTAAVHLKIDTGLARAGARREDWDPLIEAAVAMAGEGTIRIVGVWTHLAEASDEADSIAIARFAAAADALDAACGAAALAGLGLRRPIRHLAASAAAFARADSRFDLVRIGAFGYGIAPGSGLGPDEIGLEPVMALRVSVARASDGLAMLDIGSADGLPSAGPGLLTAGSRHGRVTIEAIEPTRTLIADSLLAPGDIVTFFGAPSRDEPSLQEWADALGTIGEEIIVRLSPAIERRTVG